jgi:hypothetical protein
MKFTDVHSLSKLWMLNCSLSRPWCGSLAANTQGVQIAVVSESAAEWLNNVAMALLLTLPLG